MNERLAKAEALFHEACELAPERREAFLRQSCGEDADLLREVTALLRAAGIADQWLKDSDCAAAEADLGSSYLNRISEGPGTVVGRYKLLEKIGEGGFGVVYMAEQEAPVRRKVALKIIKLGMDTKSVIARFEAERQALALMDHPNIAKVHDAGATDTGRPYFVMELVRGVPVTRFCGENQLGTTERLELFIQVCSAVQHAHQKGVIHRDIKPTNVLVTLNDGVPHPMLIDFGVAKAINQRLTEKTLFTNFGQMIGTPAYMSPEQAEMSKLDVDTRSDIYSLGVLLYELLTGTTPFPEERLRRSGYVEMQRIICEEKPEKPSTKLTRAPLAADPKRGIPQSQIKNQKSKIENDLDWIVMKCLEKDRTRRYETANGLAMDLKRHLSNEPVVARPPSRLYEFRKSVQRHKVGFVATVAVILVLLAGVLVSTWQAVRATNAKREELTARQKAQAAELVARQRAYASDMNLAKQALDQGNLGGAQDLLNRQRPRPGQKDLRGWEWRYLWGQTRSDALFTLCQISNQVNSLAASPDGNMLAVGAYHEGGVEMWDLRTRQVVTNLVRDEELVRAAFSPTAPLLAFAGTRSPASQHPQTTLHLWNIVTRQMVTNLPLKRVCMGLAFSKDGRVLVTSTAYGHITLWRMPDGTRLTNYSSRQMWTIGTDFTTTPDLSLAAYAMGSWIRVVDLRDGTNLWTKKAATDESITALAFSPDGRTLASGAGFRKSDIRLWDVATGKGIGRLAGHASWVSSLVFWPDGKKLASSSADQTIRVWDVASRKCLDVLRGHRDEIWRVGLLPDDKTLVSGGKDGTVCLWDTSTNHPRNRSATLPANIWGWCFAADSQSVLTLDGRGQVTRWSGPDFQREEPLLRLPAGRHITAYAFSKGGRFLAVGLTNGTVQVWDLAAKVLRRQLTNPAGPIIPLMFQRDGKDLGTAGPSLHLFQTWDLTTGLETWTRTMRWGLPHGALSPDGRVGVGLSRDRGVVVYLTGRPAGAIRTLDILEGSRVTFSPDGRRLAASSNQEYVRVWDTATWREEATLRGFLHAACSVGFSPDGKRLAAGGASSYKRMILWDTDSWQAVLTLAGQGPDLRVVFTAFSPDGNTLGAVNEPGALVLWRAPSWAEIHAAEKTEQAVTHPPQVGGP
jgi:eukaryotic-like serine/threonine-protein kinase